MGRRLVEDNDQLGLNHRSSSDRYGEAARLLGRHGGRVLLIRPDGYLALRCAPDVSVVSGYLSDVLGSPVEATR